MRLHGIYGVNVERVKMEKRRMKKDKRKNVEWMKWSKSRLGTENRRDKTARNKQHFFNKDLPRRAFSLIL